MVYKTHMANPDQVLKKTKINIVDFVIVLSVVASPIVGALSLIMVFILTLYTLISCLKVKYFKGSTNFPFKLLGIIFISYFIYFSLHGLALEDNLYQLKRAVQKIVPILIIGILAFTTQDCTFSLNHKFFGTLTTWSLYLTFFFAVLIFVIDPQFIFMGHTLASKSLVFERLQMGTHNPLIFSIIMTTLGFLSLLSFEEKTFFGKITSLIILLICILIVFFWNGSRGPILVCLPLCIISTWYLKPNINKFYQQTNKKIFWVILISTLFISFTFIYLNLIQQSEVAARFINGIISLFFDTVYLVNNNERIEIYGHEYAAQFPNDVSVLTRLIMWVNALEALSVKPIFGYGISHKMDAVLPFIKKSSDSYHLFLNYNHLHNIFINHLISGGVFGFLILILYLFSAIFLIKRANLKISRDSKYFIMIVLTSLMLNGLTNVILMHELLSHFFSMLIFLFLICSKNELKPMKVSASRSIN